MTVVVGYHAHFAIKVDCRATLAVTKGVIANAVKQSIAVLQKTGSPRFARDDGGVDCHVSLAMTVGVGCYAQFVIKVDCHPALAVTNVVIANAVKQSIGMLQKTGSPRFARDDGCGWTATLGSR
jgi:hypothetical protein